MRRAISRVFRAIDRDPGPFLIGASAILVVVFWHLPVPPFLFADAGSGSGGAPCTCQLPKKNCESWAYKTGKCTPTQRAWEYCAKSFSERSCPTNPRTQKKWPRTYFYYEYYSPLCNNGKKCTHDAPPPGQSHVVEECFAAFERTVGVVATGTEGVKTIEFKPILFFDFLGFNGGNVCNPTQTDKQMKFESGLFASMKVCGGGPVVDPTKNADPGLVGWEFKEHTFKWTQENGWYIDPVEPASRRAAFNISKACDCAALPDELEEEVRFVCHVKENTGVRLGNEGPAAVRFALESDTTTCSPSP